MFGSGCARSLDFLFIDKCKKKKKTSLPHTHDTQLPVTQYSTTAPICHLIGYSCPAAGAYHIILPGTLRFHPITFPFVLLGCSDANLLQ